MRGSVLRVLSLLICFDQGLPFWLFKGGFTVSSGTLKWCRSNYGTDFDKSEIAGLVILAGNGDCMAAPRGGL